MPNISFAPNVASIHNSISQLNQSTQKLSNPNENTDVTQTVVDEKIASSSISLNINVIKTKAETLGTLLDLVA